MTLIAMEPPVSADADALRDEKVKVMRATRSLAPGDVVRGQADRWSEGLSPWRLERRGERWYGRGTADNKGQHSINLAALAAVLAERGRLGFNVDDVVGNIAQALVDRLELDERRLGERAGDVLGVGEVVCGLIRQRFDVLDDPRHRCISTGGISMLRSLSSPLISFLLPLLLFPASALADSAVLAGSNSPRSNTWPWPMAAPMPRPPLATDGKMA